MSLTTKAAQKAGDKIRESYADRKSRQCPARPGGRQCTRTVRKNAGAEATCGRPECARAMAGL